MLHAQNLTTMALDQDSNWSEFLGGLSVQTSPDSNVCTPGTDNRDTCKATLQLFSSATFDGDQWVQMRIEVNGVRHSTTNR